MGNAVVDKDIVWQRVGGKPNLMLKIIQQFLDFYPRQVSVIEEAVNNQDAETLHRASHRLKGAVANFEALPLVLLAGQLETNGREGKWELVVPSLDQLKAGLQELSEELRALAAEVSRALG